MLRDLTRDLAEHDVSAEDCLFFAQSNDGVVVGQAKQTYTPITAKLLNYKLGMRGLLQSILLLGFMPPGVKNYQNMLLPVVEMFQRRCPYNGEALTVFDAHRQAERQVHLVCAWIANDTRGVPHATCGKQAPCYIGSCTMCCCLGSHLRNMVLPGAVRALPRGYKQARIMSHAHA